MHRNWGIILQQAWAMFLKDKISNHTSYNGGGRSNNNTNVRRRLCFDFNSGICTFGKRCKFDHRCSFCNKFGHGSFNCRKAKRNNYNQEAGSSQQVGHQNLNNEGKDSHRWDKYEKNQANHNNNKQ